MDSLSDILTRKDFDEPSEIRAIKKFVQDNYQESVEVIVREREIVVAARSSSLVATLRLNVRRIQKAANTDKRFIFRIG